MEIVLDSYKRPYVVQYSVVCMDDSHKQLIAETKTPLLAVPGQPYRGGYEYKRCVSGL